MFRRMNPLLPDEAREVCCGFRGKNLQKQGKGMDRPEPSELYGDEGASGWRL